MNSFTERNSKLAKFRNLDIERTPTPRPKPHSKRILVIAISAAIIVAIAALTFGLLAKTVPVIQTAPAVPVTSVSPGTTLSATGYIVAHHKIDETQRFRPVKSMAVEKTDITLKLARFWSNSKTMKRNWTRHPDRSKRRTLPAFLFAILPDASRTQSAEYTTALLPFNLSNHRHRRRSIFRTEHA